MYGKPIDDRSARSNAIINGVLFELATTLVVGSIVSFTIKMPAEAMGTLAREQTEVWRRITREAGHVPE